MEWWYYALFAIVLVACAIGARFHRGNTTTEDQELNRRIDERIERLDFTRRNRDS